MISSLDIRGRKLLWQERHYSLLVILRGILNATQTPHTRLALLHSLFTISAPAADILSGENKNDFNFRAMTRFKHPSRSCKRKPLYFL